MTTEEKREIRKNKWTKHWAADQMVDRDVNGLGLHWIPNSSWPKSGHIFTPGPQT